MLNIVLEQIKDFILLKNTYFDKGYSGVYQTDEGILEGQKVLFPADELGDYFYLRQPNIMRFDYTNIMRVNDCDNPAGLAADIILVACMRQADSDVLLDNLVQTLMHVSINGVGLKLTGMIMKNEFVVQQELRLLKKDVIDKALQNMGKDYAIVSVQFTLTKVIKPKKLSCIEKPCIEC